MATRSAKDAPVAKSSKPPSATTSTTISTTTSSTSASTSSSATTTTPSAASSSLTTTMTAATTSSVPTAATAPVSSGVKNARIGDRSIKMTAVAPMGSAAATTGATSTVSSSSTGGSAVAPSAAVSSSAAASSSVTMAISTTTETSTLGASSTKQAAAVVSSSSSSPTDDAAAAPLPPMVAAESDPSQCALCGGESSDSPDDMMQCLCCGCAFHARCANLPQTPEEGDTFCRWECFSSFRKNQAGGVAPKTPLADFSKLAARVHSMLDEMPRHGGPHHHHHHQQAVSASASASSRDKDPQTARLRERSKRGHRGANGQSRSPSPYHSHDGSERGHGSGHNGYSGDRRLADDRERPRRASPNARSSAQPPTFNPHVDLTLDDDGDVAPLPPPRSPRARPPRGTSNRPPVDDSPFDDADELRSKRQKYLSSDDPVGNGRPARRDSYPPPPSRRGHSPSANGDGGYANDIAPHYPAGADPRQGFSPGAFDGHRARGASGSSWMASLDDEQLSSSRPSSGRTGRPGSGGTRYSDTKSDEYEAGPRGVPPPPRSRPSSADDGSSNSTSRRARGPPAEVGPASSNRQQLHAAAAMPPPPPPSSSARHSVPWLNPAAFPTSLRERFHCAPDNANGVFRIDLSPVFADKTTHLYQSEIDFFFRCFESADVSLVVKGMASELNQYIWAWPFILESCGSETHFSFDHFQFRHTAASGGEIPELEYVGELRLSMAAYNAYLERYLSGSAVGNDVVVLEDHATKKSISLVAGENIIALNNLVIAEHCAQLYNDLIKSFQWDVFAGGIHCLLQYLPQANRHKRFASPVLHFNFPGARGRLQDPGNGTTDTAYQVLTGALELVVFERLEPKDRDTFLRVLHAAGYDASKKSMLLDSHLRILRDSGFAWSTVLLSDGEFVHVNKGRLHFWRVVEAEANAHSMRRPLVNAPCVFLSWEWVYQGVSQRGISTECWFAMKNANLCTGGWAFDPRRAIVEAAKCGVAIVRTGQFLNSLSGPGAPPVLRQLAFTGASPASIDRDVVAQRQEQMVLFLESILPCMDAIVEEEFEWGLVKDDSDDFRKVFDDEIMWKVVDTALTVPASDQDYVCGICSLELTNIYKQCLGCTVHTRRRRPNAAYPVFRICLRCHAQPERHHFKPRKLHGFYDRLCSSEGHTGLLPATRRYQAERSYFKCRCAPYVRCADCGGCESCCCLCHTLFQTRFRSTAPEHLDHLRTDVVDVIKWHKQQTQNHQHLARSGR